METIAVPESYGNHLKKLERAQKFAEKMVVRLSDEEGSPGCIVLVEPVRPSFTTMGFEVEIDSEADRWETLILPLQESQWKSLLDHLSFALRWVRENDKKPAEAAV